MNIRATDIFLAVLSGVLSALAFPKFNLFFLGWISLLPLLAIISKKPPRSSFFLGLIAGASFYGLLIYWIPSVPAHYGNIPLGLSILIYLVLILFLALFWAFFFLLWARISQSFPLFSFWLAPCLWVSFEYLLTYLFSGFPWGLLGHSQHPNLAFIQMASETGVYGLSFVLVLFQSLAVLSLRTRKKIYFMCALALALLLHLSGAARLKPSPLSQDSFTVSAIQGNVSSDIYWDRISEKEIRDFFDQHLRLSRQAWQKGARLIVWPEFSVPLCFSCSHGLYQDFKEQLYSFAQETDCTLLVGSNEISENRGETLYYNSALCISPDLSLSEYYKMHLVPFGEYTPYKKVFFFIEKLTHAIGEVTPGRDYHLHHFEGKAFGSPICYEIIFPHLVRKFVAQGAKFLVTITNDGWYGRSSAPYQHFAIAVFRAVENRRYLVRAATTGISGVIDPYGRILARSEIQTQTFLKAKISPSSKLSFYMRFGDLLPWLSLTLSAVSFILALFSAKRGEKLRP